jgi:hypothetical protein
MIFAVKMIITCGNENSMGWLRRKIAEGGIGFVGVKLRRGGYFRRDSRFSNCFKFPAIILYPRIG